MARPLTPEELELYEKLKIDREELYEKAKQKRTQANKAYQKYSKLISAHEYFVDQHNKIDQKLFLLTPGITKCKAHRPDREAPRNTSAKRKPKKFTIADVLGESGIEDKLKEMIAEKRRKAQLEKNIIELEK